jgi:uncharacterized protein (TIGR02687 family)
MSHTVIQKSLQNHFAKNRVVFWYDAGCEWSDELGSLELDGVEILTIDNDELTAKFRVLRDEPERQFLLYFPSARPDDAENWMLDILLSNAEFHADRASLHLDDVGLPPEFKNLTKEHERFFQTKKNREALKKRLHAEDAPAMVRRRMMAVLVQSPDDSLDSIILHLASQLRDDDYLDPVTMRFDAFGLVGAFWKEIERQFAYRNPSPSLLDFLIEVFKHNAPIGKESTSALGGQATVFLSRWKDSQSFKAKFRELSARIEGDLQVKEALSASKVLTPLIELDADAYEAIEQATLSKLRKGILDKTLQPEERRNIIERRSRSTWYGDYEDLYQALHNAGEMFEQIDSIDLQNDSLASGIRSYSTRWWKVDFHYRKFQQHTRGSGRSSFLDELAERVEARYLNDYLIHLATRWEDWTVQQSTWPPSQLPAQRGFFVNTVKPHIDKGQKLFVIVSDALRFECAQELLHRFLKEDRYQAELDSCLANLPSFTQMGMAAILPHKKLRIADDGKTVSADGEPTSGSENRQKILEKGSEASTCVIQASKFLQLNTKTEGRPLMRQHEVFYIMHNVIDKVGDDKMTEHRLASACATALDEILEIAKKVANINGTNMVITSDHGFLFQQSAVEDADCPPMPSEGAIHARTRRWIMGTGLKSDTVIRVYEPEDLGLDGNQQIGFVKGIQRLPIQGAGKRYVHGGAMPQEVIIPVLTVNKTRTSTVRSVTIEVHSVPNRITTSRVPIRLYQTEPVSDSERVQPRELRIGLFAQDNTLLSDLQTISFKSTDEDPRQREVQIALTLGHKAEEYNNKDVVLRMEENIPGTSQTRRYNETNVRLARHFGSDFDDL